MPFLTARPAAALVAVTLLATLPLAVGQGAVAKETVAAKGAAEKKADLAALEHFLLIEPRNLRGEVFVLPEGARRTVFSAARKGRLGPRHFSREEFKAAFPDGWKQFYKQGVEAAAKHLESLKPKFVRDSQKVIEYAIMESDHPLTATTILAPKFRAKFTETLGEELLIAIPNRTTILVFPKLASKMPEFYDLLADLHQDAVYPASGEVFELSRDGIRVVGAFRDR